MNRSGGPSPWTGIARGQPAPGMGDMPLLLGLCMAALGVTFLTIGPPGPRHGRGHRLAAETSGPVVARPAMAPPPAVEPPEPLPITPEDARLVNAAIPFVDGPISPARKFKYTGTAEDRERASICLASAAWYEAGDDKEGEQAVVQVVLNRLRHPAFPKTICGVVFEGATRKSGCQFTFTCDGALARIPSLEAWQRARAIADRALAGYVFKKIGNATHYHTDWVVPYWSATLDKLVAVHTHLFYRWRGWWGTAGAFTGRPNGAETLDPRIAYLAFKTPAMQPLAMPVLAAASGKGLRVPAPLVTIAPAAPDLPSILPLAPDARRRVLPPVAGMTPLASSGSAAARSPVSAQPRVTMSFNRPGDIAR